MAQIGCRHCEKPLEYVSGEVGSGGSVLLECPGCARDGDEESILEDLTRYMREGSKGEPYRVLDLRAMVEAGDGERRFKDSAIPDFLYLP